MKYAILRLWKSPERDVPLPLNIFSSSKELIKKFAIVDILEVKNEGKKGYFRLIYSENV